MLSRCPVVNLFHHTDRLTTCRNEELGVCVCFQRHNWVWAEGVSKAVVAVGHLFAL